MTTAAYPIHELASPFQRMLRALRSLLQRVQAIDLSYVDPWERKRL